jgi:hypothetical protein
MFQAHVSRSSSHHCISIPQVKHVASFCVRESRRSNVIPSVSTIDTDITNISMVSIDNDTDIHECDELLLSQTDINLKITWKRSHKILSSATSGLNSERN